MNKNCEYCNDPEELCNTCKTMICEECYNIIAPYLDEDDPWKYKIFTCDKCASKYPEQKTIKQG